MVQIVPNRKDGHITVHMTYGPKRSVIVKLKPDKKHWFVATSVKLNGHSVTSDQKYRYEEDALRELRAWFVEFYKPQSSHVRVTGMIERVEIAFVTVLMEHEAKQTKARMPLLVSKKDLNALQLIASDMRSEIVRLKDQARNESRRLHGEYLQDIKTSALSQWQERTGSPESLRDFYSSVLGKAFGWQGGKIPRPIYEDAQKYKRGIDLAYSYL